MMLAWLNLVYNQKSKQVGEVMEFLYLIIGVVIIGTLALIFQRYRRKKALKLIQLDSQNLTDVAMEESLTNLKLLNESLADSVLISDVWGKGGHGL